MESNPIEDWFNRTLKVPILADVQFGVNGADVYEMDGLTEEVKYDFSVHDLPYELPEQETPPDDGARDLEPHLWVPEYYN